MYWELSMISSEIRAELRAETLRQDETPSEVCLHLNLRYNLFRDLSCPFVFDLDLYPFKGVFPTSHWKMWARSYISNVSSILDGNYFMHVVSTKGCGIN